MNDAISVIENQHWGLQRSQPIKFVYFRPQLAINGTKEAFVKQ